MSKYLKYYIGVILLIAFLILVGIHNIIDVEKEIEDYIIVSSDSQGEVVIADIHNNPPYSYSNNSGEYKGFNLQVTKEALENMGYSVVVKLGDWSEIQSELKNGTIDVITGMVPTKNRLKEYSFSTRHSIVIGDVFSKNRLIDDISDLNGETVVVLKNDIMHHYLNDQELDINFIVVNDYLEAFKLANVNDSYYVASMKNPGYYIIKTNNYNELKASNLNITLGDYSMAVKKGNEKMIYTLNAGLQVLNSTGRYQEIYDQWLGVYHEKSFYDQLKDYSWLFCLILLFIFVLVILIFLLRYIVFVKTKELKDANNNLIIKNEEIEAAYEELIAVEDELRSQYSKLQENQLELNAVQELNNGIIFALPDLLFLVDINGCILKEPVNSTEHILLSGLPICGQRLKNVLPNQIANDHLYLIEKAISKEELQKSKFNISYKGNAKFFESRISKSGNDKAIIVIRDMTEIQEHSNRIEYLSTHDVLTGLNNRRSFESIAQKFRDNSNNKLAIIVADVNGLKLVNDAFGHTVGDKLLKTASRIFKEAVNNNYDIYRMGGDEFAIIMPNKSIVEADKIVQKIESKCKQYTFESVELSISLGAQSNMNSDKTFDEILIEADNYMYKKKLFEAPSMRSETIDIIINSLHEKNPREEEHSQRVSYYCEKFAKVLEFTESDIKEMKTAGLLHDIGKIAISENLLNKAGALTDDEFKEIKSHPGIGYRILSTVNSMSEMADYVLYHHEKWDGSGYPKGLIGNEIPLQSRILTIVDSFDAMISERSYKEPLSVKEATDEIIRCAGKHFDPELVDIFINNVLEQDKILINNYSQKSN